MRISSQFMIVIFTLPFQYTTFKQDRAIIKASIMLDKDHKNWKTISNDYDFTAGNEHPTMKYL
jgi:hypothetical protein